MCQRWWCKLDLYIVYLYRIYIYIFIYFIYLFICFLIHVYICIYIYIPCIYIHVYLYTLHAFVYCVRVFVCMFKSLPLTKTMGKTPQFKNSAFVLGLLGRENWLKSIVGFITFETFSALRSFTDGHIGVSPKQNHSPNWPFPWAPCCFRSTMESWVPNQFGWLKVQSSLWWLCPSTEMIPNKLMEPMLPTARPTRHVWSVGWLFDCLNHLNHYFLGGVQWSMFLLLDTIGLGEYESQFSSASALRMWALP